MFEGAILALALSQQSAAEAAPVREVARGVYLLPGAVPENRGPDGNTVMVRAGRGLIVVDTGRHSEHSDAILAFAAAQRRPVTTIVNTHWHLDHSSGNRRIKAVFPNARVYTTTAIDRAMGEGGFLTQGLARAEQRLQAPDIGDAERSETNIFIETMQHREFLRPDVPLDHSGRMRLGGKMFDVHVTNHAVSDADVWLYDRSSRIVVIGDLVTFPAPFFETACPQEWSEELDAVWAAPFRTVIPGHGEPMTREQFGVYRAAFNAFMACVSSDAVAAACASGWANGIASLEPDNATMHAAAAPYAEYYVGFLRTNGGKAPTCQLER